MTKKICYYRINNFTFGIAECDGFITDVFVGKKDIGGYVEESTPTTDKAAEQLSEYFKGERTFFELPIALKGTDFQKKVWNAVSEIPYGRTVTYKDIAVKTGDANASRAVGGALNKNPTLIMIPCHRVVGKAKDNKFGFGCGEAMKKILLNIEGSLSEVMK